MAHDTELLMQIAKDIGNLQGDVRSVLTNQAGHSDRLEKHSKRLVSLERDRWTVRGGVAVISLAVSAAFTWFTSSK